MIFKWMKFYSYHPGLAKEVDKPRRDELKDHLNLPSGYGQRLGSFIINKFNTFKRWGLIYEVSTNQGVKYHEVTDAWLSRTWDGNVEHSMLALSQRTRSPFPSKIIQKRPTSSPPREINKQQSLASGSTMKGIDDGHSENLNSTELSASQSMGPDRAMPRVRSCRSCRDPRCYYNRSTAESLQREATSSTSTKKQYASPYNTAAVPSGLLVKPSVTPNLDEANSDSLEQQLQSSRPRSSHSPPGKSTLPDHHELSARLERVAARGSTTSEDDLASERGSSNLTDKSLQRLGVLKEKEKACREELRKNMEELELARDAHNLLRERFEESKAELRTSLQMLDRARKRNIAVVPPTPIGISEEIFAQSLQEVRQQWRDSNNRARITAEIKELESNFTAQSIVKSRLQTIVFTQKAQLKELQRTIKERLEESAQDASSQAYIEGLLNGLMDVGSEGSGAISPVESMVSDTVYVDEMAD